MGKEKMLKRLENYIQKVIEHYDGVNSPYRGIYAWDVVNEQIEPDDFHPENPGSVRYTCNNKNTGWYNNIFQGHEALPVICCKPLCA